MTEQLRARPARPSQLRQHRLFGKDPAVLPREGDAAEPHPRHSGPEEGLVIFARLRLLNGAFAASGHGGGRSGVRALELKSHADSGGLVNEGDVGISQSALTAGEQLSSMRAPGAEGPATAPRSPRSSP